MHDIMHRIEIDAPTERLYAALTSRDGLASWWTPDVELKAGEGGEAVFGFDNHDVVFRMRIDRLVENERVEWRCEGEVDEYGHTGAVRALPRR